jgi:hypothetical protein
MRFVMALLLVVANPASLMMAASQTEDGVFDQGRIAACSLLTPEVAKKFTTVTQRLVIIPPSEEAMGEKGSACDYLDIRLQVDPFARADSMRKSPGKDWQPLSGVGDTAFFHNNRDRYAELMVWTGTHHFTIQMGVPDGSTAEKVKPNTIGVANAIIPKLK